MWGGRPLLYSDLCGAMRCPGEQKGSTRRGAGEVRAPPAPIEPRSPQQKCAPHSKVGAFHSLACLSCILPTGRLTVEPSLLGQLSPDRSHRTHLNFPVRVRYFIIKTPSPCVSFWEASWPRQQWPPKGLWICYFPWQKGPCRYDSVKDFEIEGFSGWARCDYKGSGRNLGSGDRKMEIEVGATWSRVGEPEVKGSTLSQSL
uniref:Uncharacterized protein n=1 Tax=Rousettus aegyptiacus TaxID=9407 RepID=A0A7J8H1I5_ROUAE|nr:hypothetical protein HJG63_011381 [Rousettus aegyptiacus]